MKCGLLRSGEVVAEMTSYDVDTANFETVNVTVLLLEDGLPSTAITPAEVLGNAGALWDTLYDGRRGKPFFDIQTASLDGAPVQAGAPVRLTPDTSIRDVRRPGLVVVPAVGLDLETSLERHRFVVQRLLEWRAQGTAIAAVCTGVAILAETGLLDGRPATTHWGVVDRYRRRYPKVEWRPERFVTESDDLFCCAGVYACVDLSLHLVERFCGRQIALQTSRALLLDPPRRWQSAYAEMPAFVEHEDQAIIATLDWLRAHLGADIRVNELAARAHMSPRNFARRFHAVTGDTPIRYLHRLRINEARRLLESGGRTVRAVCNEVGYEDLPFFRRLFKRYTGISPKEYAQRYAPTRPHDGEVGLGVS